VVASVFSRACSIRAVEEALTRSPSGALSPATAFGADFVLTIPGTSQTDTIPAEEKIGRLADWRSQ
jgi:short subunit dehydrogenase-like uncharacterized protein